MSRRRRASPPADSLELLLDTLCNTFGGILFIAILVVVLLQLTGARSAARGGAPVRADELKDLADELEVVTREVEALRTSVPDAKPGGPAAAALAGDPVRRLAEARRRLEEVTRLRDEKLVEASRHDADALAVDEELADEKARAERATREATELRREIGEERRARARVIRTPVMHRSEKLRLAVELRYSRLYVLHRHSPSGERLGPNLDHYVVLSEQADELNVTADPTRGLPLSRGPELAASIGRALSRFPSGRWVLDLAVRPDSFGAFHTLSEVAHGLGYEMRTLLVEEDGAFRDRGGTRQEVQ